MCHSIARCVALTLIPLALAATAWSEESPPPCNQDSRFNQQDFALGDWDVYSEGKKSATVRLEKILKGCGIHETWTALENSGENGVGLFTYSRLLGHWGYFWVADKGWTTAFTGDQHSSNEMQYITFAPMPDGARKERHWTLKLQADGSIQELSLGSVDGRNWTKEYELIWQRRKR